MFLLNKEVKERDIFIEKETVRGNYEQSRGE